MLPDGYAPGTKHVAWAEHEADQRREAAERALEAGGAAGGAGAGGTGAGAGAGEGKGEGGADFSERTEDVVADDRLMELARPEPSPA